MKTFSDISYGYHKDNVLDVHIPDCNEFPVLVYIHGGGMEHGDKVVGDNDFIKYLTQRGIAVVSANYRMYPDASYPDFLKDGAAVVAWTLAHIEEYGKCTKVFVSGSSAGAYITMMLCFDKRYYAQYKVNPADVAGYIHDAGQPTAHFNVLRERGIDSRKEVIDETAPLYYIGEAKEYPPMKFIISDNDMPCRYEQTMLTLASMKRFKYDMDKVEHIVMHGTHTKYIRELDENGESIYGKLMYDFIKKYI